MQQYHSPHGHGALRRTALVASQPFGWFSASRLFEMKERLLAVAAVAEGVTGLILLIYPPIVVKLLFGAEITGAGVVMSRIAGIGLIGLGVACWPCEKASCALCGMLTYSSLATLYLFYLGLGGGFIGILLWPAVVLHAALTLLLARSWIKAREDKPA